MRLSKIKLAGFKSFVDPTIIPFVSNLSAVVGPNGCGKSNVMDAIRWVMGESSAKHLRGGQLTDVIFSGSSSRKPLGQASVEMARRRQHRLELCLADSPVGSRRRWRLRVPATVSVAGKAHVSQPVR